MVGRRSSTGNKKSPVAAEPALASRPKRNISPKTYDITAGLSWKEERELKKALYASLQESKRPSTPRPGNDTPTESDNPDNAGFRPIKVKKTLSRRTRSSSSSAPSTPMTTCQSVSCVDETSQESTMSSVTSVSTLDSKKTKVRAQRKFAMNQPNNIVSTNQTSTSVPCTETGITSTSKTGEKTSSTIVFPKRAKTEDFLTFLCLRGTPLLPPHLDFFNYSRYDNSLTNGRNGRDSSPSSSSTSLSNVTEDHTFTPVNKFTTPCKKAARASAGTPETCRGLAGVKRMDKSPKTKSPLARRGRPARSLNITPVKVSPSKERLPAKVLNTRLEKRGLGKARLASKRKAVATLTHRASPAKLKPHPTEEQQNEPDKVTDGVRCCDSIVCSVHDRIGDGTSKCVECSPMCSSHIDASLTSFCMSNDLFPLVPSNLSILQKEHIFPQQYPAWQREIVVRKKENPSQILTGHNEETLPSEVIQDDQTTRDSMLYANLPQEKKTLQIMATPLSAADVLFAISAVQVWKTEAEDQHDICVTNPQLLSTNQIKVLADNVPTINEELVAFDEEKLLEVRLSTGEQVCPQEENPPLLIGRDNTADLVQLQEQLLADESQNSLPASTEMSIPENEDSYQSIIDLPMIESNTTGKVVEFCSSPLTDRFLLNPKPHLCEVYPDQLHDTQKCSKPSEQKHKLNSEIVKIKAANAYSSIHGDSIFQSQHSTDTCIRNFNSTCTENLINYDEYDTPLDLSLPKESKHGLQSLHQGSEHVPQELNNSISMCDLDFTRITLNSGNVPQFLKKGTTTIKVEDDKIIIKNQSNREPDDKGHTEGQGVNLKVMNKCVDKRKVKVVVPCSLINGNSSPKVSVINSNNYAAIQELPSPQFKKSSGDQMMPLGWYSDIPNQIKQEVIEEPEQTEPLKKPPRTKSDAIQLGSNVFSSPSRMSQFVWKSSKLPVFDIMQSSSEKNLFSKSKTQQCIESSEEESPISSPKHLMPDLLQNLSQSCRSKRFKRSPYTAITTVNSSQFYSTYTSKPFLLPEQVQKTPTNNSIGNPSDVDKNIIGIPSNEETFGSEFTFRDDSYKECLRSMTQADYNGNPASTQQWPPTWLKQYTHPDIADQNNNTQGTEENGGSSEEDRDEDKEYLQIHKPYSSSSQPINSMENNQIPELEILQYPTEEHGCNIQNISNQPLDENQNISTQDDCAHGGTLSVKSSSSISKTNSQFGKKLFPLPPTIMSSWYY